MKNKTSLPAFLILSLLFALAACNDDKEIEPEPPILPHWNKTDSLALIDIYQKGDGKNWDIKWDLNNFYTWGGVSALLDSATMEWRVIKLIIPSGTQEGTLSPKVGDMTWLLNLSLGGEGFYGEIPKKIGNLPVLRTLWITNTNMTGGIPKEIFKLKKLRELYIGGNKHLTSLPVEIAEFTPENFIECLLPRNGFTGKVPKDIKVRMNLEGNNFSEVPFEYYTNPTAPYLNLWYNKISGILPDSIVNNPVAMKKVVEMTIHQQDGYGYTNIPQEYIDNYQ